MRGINKLLTFVAVTLCFFMGTASDSFIFMGLSIFIAVTAFILEAYDVSERVRRGP